MFLLAYQLFAWPDGQAEFQNFCSMQGYFSDIVGAGLASVASVASIASIASVGVVVASVVSVAAAFP
ncbi:hypothetical protein A2U01_0074409 [Trifolium medium]|uniref:Uncharacterized protein n=1 Tax=Trifolium medium TaxID=97028 RepID=A0A392SWH1_9FABA|nr:hypothetical protein [Trifolium medium]